MALKKSDKWLIATVAAVFLFGAAVLTGGVLLYRALRKSLAPPAAAQGEGPPLEWERTFTRGDMGRGELVEQTADGGFIVAATVWEGGTVVEEGPVKIHLLKTGADGSLAWETVLDGENLNDLVTVEEGAQGGYFMLANRMEEQERDYFEYTAEAGGERGPVAEGSRIFASLIKTDDRGNPEWEKEVGQGRRCRAGAGRKTGDGGCVIFGPLEKAGGRTGYYLVKVDPAGEVAWEQALAPEPGGAEGSIDTMISTGFSLIPSAGGGYTCIAAHPVQGSMVFSVFKTDESGNTLESSSFSLEGFLPGCFAADPAPGDGLVVGTNGNFNLLTLFSPSLNLIRVDHSGNLQWEREHRRAGDISSVTPLSDGGWIISSSTFTFYPVPGPNLHLLKIGSSGDLVWKKTFVSELDGTSGVGSYADQVRETAEGALIVTGMKEGKILLLKVAPEKQ